MTSHPRETILSNSRLGNANPHPLHDASHTMCTTIQASHYCTHTQSTAHPQLHFTSVSVHQSSTHQHSKTARSAVGYYAVAQGRKTGIFSSWAECEPLVYRFKGARHKKFITREEAENFLHVANVPYQSNSVTLHNIPLTRYPSRLSTCPVHRTRDVSTPSKPTPNSHPESLSVPTFPPLSIRGGGPSPSPPPRCQPHLFPNSIIHTRPRTPPH